MNRLRNFEKEQRAQEAERKNLLHTYWKLGVFKKTVNSVTVGYFVGWRYRWSTSQARNIRKNLFFDTPDAAIAFRDSIEATRRDMVTTDEQIA